MRNHFNFRKTTGGHRQTSAQNDKSTCERTLVFNAVRGYEEATDDSHSSIFFFYVIHSLLGYPQNVVYNNNNITNVQYRI